MIISPQKNLDDLNASYAAFNHEFHDIGGLFSNRTQRYTQLYLLNLMQSNEAKDINKQEYKTLIGGFENLELNNVIQGLNPYVRDMPDSSEKNEGA